MARFLQALTVYCVRIVYELCTSSNPVSTYVCLSYVHMYTTYTAFTL